MSGLHLKQKADGVFAQQLQRNGADSADTHEAWIWPLVDGKKLWSLEVISPLWCSILFPFDSLNSPYERPDLLIKMWKTSFYMNRSVTSLADTVRSEFAGSSAVAAKIFFRNSFHAEHSCECTLWNVWTPWLDFIQTPHRMRCVYKSTATNIVLQMRKLTFIRSWAFYAPKTKSQTPFLRCLLVWRRDFLEEWKIGYVLLHTRNLKSDRVLKTP